MRVVLALCLLVSACAPHKVPVNTVVHRPRFSYYCTEFKECTIVAYPDVELKTITKEIGCGVCVVERQTVMVYKIRIHP